MPCSESDSYLFPNHFVTSILLSFLFLVHYRNITTDIVQEGGRLRTYVKVPIRHNFHLLSLRTVNIEQWTWCVKEDLWQHTQAAKKTRGSILKLQNSSSKKRTGPKTPKWKISRTPPAGGPKVEDLENSTRWWVLLSLRTQPSHLIVSGQARNGL